MPFCLSLFLVNFSFENAYIGQCAVFFIVVKTVADNELIGNLFAYVIGNEINLAAGGLVEHGAGLDTASTAFLEQTCEEREGATAVDDVLYDKKVELIQIVALQVEKDADVACGGGRAHIDCDV
mgnify:CR=1 FL=1